MEKTAQNTGTFGQILNKDLSSSMRYINLEGLNKEQIIDKYEFGKLLPCFLPAPFHKHNFEIFLRKPYYKYFDSFEKCDLPLFLD